MKKIFLLLSLLDASITSIQAASDSKDNEVVTAARLLLDLGCKQAPTDPTESNPDQNPEEPSRLQRNIIRCSCGSSFSRKCILVYHIKQQNSGLHQPVIELKNSRICKFCNKSFTTLNSGIEIHEATCGKNAKKAIKRTVSEASGGNDDDDGPDRKKTGPLA